MALPNLLAKYGTQPTQSGSSSAPDLLSKYGMTPAPSPQPLLAKPSLAQLQQREAEAKAKAAQANSFGGLLKNTISAIPETAKRMGTAIADADVGKALGNTQLNNTRAGLVVNTALGLPKAAKETLFPNRGYSDQQLANAKPGFSDIAQAPFRIASEVGSAGGELLNMIPGYTGAAQSITSTKVGGQLANAGDQVKDFAVPKTAEQAKAMRFADAAQFLPIGSIKRVGQAADAFGDLSKLGKGKYATIHQGGLIKMVEGEPVKILDGVETFLHRGDGGWIVSEASTGRFLSESVSKEGAVAKAQFNIDNVGKDKFLQLLRDNKLQAQNVPIQKAPAEIAKVPKQVSELDRLIAEGKIRVTSRNGYDVFQIKKWQHWMNTRDQYSAIDQVTRGPKPIVPKVEAPHIEELKQKVAEAKTASDIAHDTLNDMPGKQLIKYRSSASGALPEVNGGKGKFNRAGDTIVQNTLGQDVSNGGDLVTAQEHLDNYVKAQARAAETKQNYLSLKKELETARSKKEPILSRSQQATPSVSSPRASDGQVPHSKIEPATNSMSEGEARSLELVAEQHRLATQGSHGGASSLEEIVQKAQTPVKKKVNLLDYIRTPDRVLKKIGLGHEAAMLHEHYDAYLKELPKNIDKITEWSKRVGKPSNERIFKYLDGGAIDLAPNELAVAHEIRNWLMNWADRLHLPKTKQISHYITHLFDDQLIQKEFDEDLAKIIRDKIPGEVYDPFLEKRLGIQGYKKDTWAALDAYAKRATRKVHMDPVLSKLEEVSGTLEESQWKYVKHYADRINLRPTDIDNLLDNFIKSTPIGYRLGGRPTARVTQLFRRIAYRAMLGLNPGSALRNISQGANTYAKLGEKYTTLGYAKLFSKSAREELVREGILNNGFIQDRALSSAKKAMEKVDKGLFFFFDTAEKINRGSAYLGAKAKALAAGKTEAEAIEMAKKLVRDTQFSFGSVDTPLVLSSDIAKTLGQFQSYTTKQIEFLSEMAKNREIAGLIRYGLAGTVFVYTIGKAFGMDWTEILPMYRFGGPPSLKVPTEVTKAVFSVPDKYGNVPSLEKKASNVGNAVLTSWIPAGTQIKKTYEGLDALNKGGSVSASGNVNFKVGGTPLKDAQALVFGKYASQEAKNYYNDVKTPDEKKAQDVYDNAQKLKAEGKIAEANTLWSALSDEQKKAYKYIKTAAKAKATRELEIKLMPLYQKLQKMKAAGQTDEANAIYNALSKEEKHAYGLIKNKFK